MIYKNPMQVKEIPIVFRGSVDAAQLPQPGKVYCDQSVTKYMSGPDSTWVAEILLTGDDRITGDEQYLDIIFDGIEYKSVPIVHYGTTPIDTYEVGAPFMSNNNHFDDQIYPFALEFPGGQEVQSLQIYFKRINATHTIKVSGPSIEGATTKKVFSADITGNGQVQSFNVRFALGENGTLRIKPYVILNGNIRVNLADFAAEGDQYIAGDNETVSFDCFVPVETHAKICVEAENTGAYASMLDAWAVVQYEDYIEEETIVGYEGVNLRRRRW